MNRQIEIVVGVYDKYNSSVRNLRLKLLEQNRFLFLANTTETGYACTVLEMPDTTNTTDVMCRFAWNEATRNVSKFVVNATFTDLGEMNGTAPLPVKLSAQVNFNQPDSDTTTDSRTTIEVQSTGMGAMTTKESDRTTESTYPPTTEGAQRILNSCQNGFLILFLVIMTCFIP